MKMYSRKSVDFDEVEEDVARAVEIRITISVWKNNQRKETTISLVTLNCEYSALKRPHCYSHQL